MTPVGGQNPEIIGDRRPQPWTAPPPSAPDVTADAVVLLPGIMGSVLADAATGQVLWGLSGRALATAWSNGGSLDRLTVTDRERHGTADRVHATGILTLPAAAPLLRGIEPYDRLRDAITTVTRPGAVMDFPYDWRLSVEHNAGLLATAARTHLGTWRRTAASDPVLAGAPRPRLVFIAHSMGGLVTAAALQADPTLAADTRAVITLGTPFHGSALSVAMLAGTHRVPLLPRDRLRALALSAPGLYDLLPIYRCLDTGTDVHLLTPEHVAALGGRLDLARRALTARRALRESAVVLPGHRPAVGITQPTPASLSIDHDTLALHTHGHRTGPDGLLQRDPDTGIPLRTVRGGDGTVYRDAAHPHHTTASAYIPARHGALTRHKTALLHVTAVLTEHDHHLGPPAGHDDIGLTVPDHVQPGRPWTLHLHTTRPPATLHATITPVDGDDEHALPLRLNRADGPDRNQLLVARHTTTTPGLYRITIDTGAGPDTHLTELLIVTEEP